MAVVPGTCVNSGKIPTVGSAVALLESRRARRDRLVADLMAVVLVIDDEADICALLREALERAGHEVFTARDGRDGMQVYLAHRPAVVITDIFMPRRSGIDLVLELGRTDPPPKMIAISGVAGSTFLEAAREANVARTFVKPFDVREVVRAVRELTG
jgi:DNA-binding NtrC family response regulator